MKKLGFGLMRLPLTDQADRSKVDVEELKRMVDLYMQRGFTYYDTAHRYNDEASEPSIRKALVERYPRESYTFTNKITLNYIKKEEDQENFFKQQLEICGLEYFDNYLIHNMGSTFYPMAEKFHTFEFLERMKKEGYVKHIGFSFHGTAEVLETILKNHPEMELVQLQINYLDWEDEGIQSRKCYEVARKYGKDIIVMEPIKGGTLVNLPDEVKQLLLTTNPDRSLASWAIRFAASLEGVIMVLSGMSDMEQLNDNTSYMDNFVPLTNEEMEVLVKAAEMIRAKKEIACTSCRYCVTECPKNIAIPDYFHLYNNMKRLKNTSYMSNQQVYYMNLTKEHGKASDCVKCGVCEKNCPQNLPIRDLLVEIANTMEP